MLAAESGLTGVLAAADGGAVGSPAPRDESAHGETLFALPPNPVCWAALRLVLAFAGSAVLLAVTGAVAGGRDCRGHRRQRDARPCARGVAGPDPGDLLAIAVAAAVFGTAPPWTGGGRVAFAVFVVPG